MKRTANNLPDLDPAVAAVLGVAAARQADRTLPRAERYRITRDRRHQAERKGHRAAYDLEPSVIRTLAVIAADYHCSASSMAAIAIFHLVNSINDGTFDPRTCLVPSPSVMSRRFEYVDTIS